MNKLFYLGIMMIAWDMLGHFFCLLARKFLLFNTFWNNYSVYIWPSISDNVKYDLFWSSWFLIALIIIVFFRN